MGQVKWGVFKGNALPYLTMKGLVRVKYGHYFGIVVSVRRVASLFTSQLTHNFLERNGRSKGAYEEG